MGGELMRLQRDASTFADRHVRGSRGMSSSAGGRVAIITGASSGIGKATAVLFAAEGFRLLLTGRAEHALQAVRDECVANGSAAEDVALVVADVTEDSAPARIVAGAVQAFGQVDALVNSAGILVNGAVLDAPIDSYDQVMDCNVRSLIRMTKEALPHLIKTKGTVVNVSSIAGPCAFPFVSYYCMSKAAVDQFTKCLALEMAPNGVRVNAVNPGVIVTEVHKRAGQTDEQYAAFLERAKTTHALGRPGEAIEVAKAVLFLASDASSFTTGHLLRIDGGRGLMCPR